MSKHRYYELRHFCLQYREWEEELNEIVKIPGSNFSEIKTDPGYLDPTFDMAERIMHLTSKMNLVKDMCFKTDESIGEYLFKAVTGDLTYVQLKSVFDIPCSRDYYYERYRKFFFNLSLQREKIYYYNE